MKKISRVFITALISAAMLMQLAACGKETAPPPREEYVYKSASAEINKDIRGEFDRFGYFGGKVYFISEYSPDAESAEAEYRLNIADAGGGYSSVPLGRGNMLLTPPAFDEDGTGYIGKALRTEEGYVYSIETIGADGSPKGSLDITSAVSGHTEDIYPSGLAVIGDNIFISGYDGILILGKDGGFAGSVTDVSGIHSVVSDRDGGAYALVWDGAAYSMRRINISAGALESAFTLEGYNISVTSGRGSGYDFLINDGTFLSGYTADGVRTELFGWTEAGVSIIEVTDIFFAGGDSFLCAGKSHPYGYPKLYAVEKRLTEVTDKKEIVLGGDMYAIDGLLENSVIKFNSANSSYHITVKKYDPENINALNLDIISGKAPDILISDPYLPVEAYISKGLFADLYGFIDSDPQISRGDFLPNLLTAFETDGKLYRFTDRFKVYTVIGKTSIFGEDKSLTLSRLGEIAAKFPADTEILPASTKQDVLRFAMEISGHEYIDFEKNTCSFDSDGFVSLLEYAGTFLSEQDYESYFDENFWNRYETMYSDESALLMITHLTDYSDIYRFERVNFGERVTAVGFPCSSGAGTSFMTDAGFSISAGSAVKEGAWEFLRTLLLPEYQDGCDNFPVRADSLKKAAKAAMKRGSGSGKYSTVLMGQMMLASSAGDIGEPAAEDIARMNDIISSARGMMTYDQNVMDIIAEEADAYFNGVRSSREAAKLIGMRVTLYLNEIA